jgi:LPS export ABC transporter protein LptC
VKREPRGEGRGERVARYRAVALALSLLAPLSALLSSCGQPRHDAVADVAQAADSADQLMIGVRLYLTNEGVRQAYVEADSAFVYENSGRTELKHVHLTFYKTATGEQASILTSDEGTYMSRSGAMEARGNCVVNTTDGGRLATSVLRFDQAKNEVSTDQPYTFTSPDKNVQGTGFVSDPSFSNITTQRVRGTAGRFTLPGQ